MRMRATLGVLTGALALSVVAVPAAQADEVEGDTTISNISVNGGKSVVVGASATKTITISFTVKDNSGVENAMALPFRGTDLDHADSAALPNTADYYSTCTAVNSTTANCKATYDFTPGENAINSAAGGWKLWILASGKDGDFVQKDNAKSFNVQRLSKLTVNASPEPVKKGKTLTVTGKLTRANWDAAKYSGYSGQSVKLQFRKSGTSTYTTLKTIKTNTYGDLKTTVTASADGYYRYSFAGTTTTPAVSAAGDYVDVQ
ncbi:calcium-binding protein [Streptomyces sp. NPDC003362]